MKQLAITADDFGLHQDLDRGIVEVCEKGIVTHVSLVANGGNIGKACQFLLRHPETTAGIHLNLTDGNPLSNPDSIRPLLNKTGNFLGLHREIAVAYLSRPSLIKAIEAEYRAQVERLLGLGIRLWQLNCHGHLHAIPQLFRLLTRLASDYRIPFVRAGKEWPSAGLFLRSLKQASKMSLLAFGFRVSKRIVKTEDRWRKNYCFGMFDSGALTLERLEEILIHLPEGFSEIICHPGYAGEEVKKIHPWSYHWEEERTLMISDQVKELIQQFQIQRVNFAKIKDAPV